MLICITLQVFGLNPKAMVHFQLFLRLVKSIALLMVLAGLVLAILFTELSIGDVFASILAFVPTGWGIISVSFLCQLFVDHMLICLLFWFILETVHSYIRIYFCSLH